MTNGTTSAIGTPTIAEQHGRHVGGEYIAIIQSNHPTLRHLLLSDHWILSDDAFYKLCQACPNLEQLGFSCLVPPLDNLRQVLTLVPKLWAIRMLTRPRPGTKETIFSADPEMHVFAVATEFWKPEYKNLKYVGIGDDLVLKLGDVYYPPKWRDKITPGQENSINAKSAGPVRKIEIVSRETVQWVEIWGLDTTEFDPTFP